MKTQKIKPERLASEQPRVVIPSTGYVRLPVILQYFPVSKSTWWAGVRSGRFPQSHKISPRVTAWRVEDIRALLER